MKLLVVHDIPHFGYGPRMMWWQRMNAVMRDQGITQAELARRSGIGINAIQKYASGAVRNPREGVIERIAHALKVEKAWLWGKNGMTAGGQFMLRDNSMKGEPGAPGAPLMDVPVYATAPTSLWGVMSLRLSPIDRVERRTGISGAPGVFAIYMQDDCMAPRYRKGEIVYIHPDRPARPGGYALVTLADGHVMVRLLVAADPDSVTVEQHTPHAIDVLRLADIASMAHALTPNELAGV